MIEVNRPDRRQRRSKGKSDPLDAYAAAEAVLSERAAATPKLGTGIVEAIRSLHTTRAGAVKARTAAINQLRTLLITAPADLRDRMRGLTAAALVAACARLRPTGDTADPPRVAVRAALRSLARRYQALTAEITDLDAQLRPLVARACPPLLALHGGKTHRHRLSRGGDRQANRALHMIAWTRLATRPKTRVYRDRRAQEQLSSKDILRCLKRYLAREVYKALTSTNTEQNEIPAAA